MADNAIANNNGAPVTFSTDEIAGAHIPRMKLMLGNDGADGGTVSNTNPLPVVDVLYDTIIDEPNATTIYICEALIGTASSAALWRVQRITTAGTVKTIRFAGTGAFDQVADNRASLSYA